MVAKAEKSAAGDAAAAPSNHQSRRRRGFNKPSWLLCAIADLDERMKMLTRKTPKGKSPDSFSERANSYYHERPQLLALLDDLYNGYLSLADRYCQVLAKSQQQQQQKPQSRCTSPNPRVKCEDVDEGDSGEVIDSDAESSLSFQPPAVAPVDADMLVADLVMKTVEYDIVENELAAVEKRWSESSRKMELQKNLLDVLESERLILLNDNATLGYRVSALADENKGLASESMFLKRKAAELARCMLKTREDHRVCLLSRKIEDLQGQIHGLEKRNKEYYEQLVKQEEKGVLVSKGTSKSSKGGEEVNLEDCFRVGGGGGGVGAIKLSKCFSFNIKKVDQNAGGDLDSRKGSKLWDKVKKLDLFQCGSHFDAATY
ncbi:kinase-interacting family protein-like [Salvia miltiorrhiza]|uniref:kinase-interacting family protein-like n=1 Tax=Salvia miltiorrhiza TaxID=226208 RepID=UPI0025ABD3EC|nr:kinase-interacting family protein-like [Salvia miltiorrhiza]XP_057812380.1 kinase-interacting family protein-like [Salvia miltiorrhiza]XP_057812381.1 kinase-interacting family protein-like [Salvia miltiorrhiza]